MIHKVSTVTRPFLLAFFKTFSALFTRIRLSAYTSSDCLASPILLNLSSHQKCGACRLCAFACPSQAITITSNPTNPHEISGFWVDLKRCMSCGICQQACPIGVISFRAQSIDLPTTSQEKLIQDAAHVSSSHNTGDTF